MISGMDKLRAWAEEWGNLQCLPTPEEALESKRKPSFVK